MLRSRAVGTGFQDKFHQCDCPAKLCAEDFSSANVGRWDTHSFVTGSDTKNAQLLARFFFRTNFINTIVPKTSENCAAKTCQSFQTLGHGTCIASLTNLTRSETKRASCWHGFFRTNSKFHQRDCPEKLVPKTSQTNAGQRDMPDMHGNMFFAGEVCVLHGVLSVDAWFSLPLQRSKLNEICISVNGQVGK